MMAKNKERISLVAEALSDMKKQLTKYRIALIISLTGNVIQAVVWFIR